MLHIPTDPAHFDNWLFAWLVISTFALGIIVLTWYCIDDYLNDSSVRTRRRLAKHKRERAKAAKRDDKERNRRYGNQGNY